MADMLQLAGCIILDDDKKILFLHRETEKRKQWEIPGGCIDPGEDAATAAVRELKEELDLEVENVNQLGDMRFEEDGHVMHYTWFKSRIVSGQVKNMEPHLYDKFSYLSMDELKNLYNELSPNARNFVDEVVAGNIKL